MQTLPTLDVINKRLLEEVEEAARRVKEIINPDFGRTFLKMDSIETRAGVASGDAAMRR